jgi:hypothetical protein
MVSTLTAIITKFDAIPQEWKDSLVEMYHLCEKTEATEKGNISCNKIAFTTLMSLVSGHDNITASAFRPE